MDDRLVNKETAFEMAEYLIAHTIVRKGFDTATFILLAQTAAMLGAMLAWKFNLGGLGLLISLVAPYATGLVFWGAALIKRYGIGGMWDKTPYMTRSSLNRLFEEMHEWQRQREAKESK